MANMTMKIEEVGSCLDKFKLYKEQEELFVEDVINCFDRIKNNYRSNNSIKIENLNLEISNKLKVISSVHNNNITVIEKNIEKYRTTDATVKNLFENIEIR